MDRSTRQKINRKIRELTDVMNQIDLADIYRTFQQNTKYVLFSQHLMKPYLKSITYLVTKQTSTDFKKTGVTPCVLSDYHRLKLEFNNNTTLRNPTNSWKLNSELLNHPWVKEEIKKEIKDFL